MTLTIIADDLTGACDTGALFCGRGRVAVFIAPAHPGRDWEVAAVDTESRALAPDAAARRMSAVGSQLGGRLAGGVVFKKIDSTLRGPIGAELDALLSAAGRSGALLCPAFPAQHRTVRDGVLYVDGMPAHQSAIGRDPDYPGATSDILEVLSAQTARPLRHLPLEAIRGPGEELARTLDRMDGGITVADAETEADLQALAGAARDRPELLLAGSAGLARAVTASLGYTPPPASLPAGSAWLVVAGSLHPATRAQIKLLAAGGAAALWVDADGAADPASLVAALRAGRPALIASQVLDRDTTRARVLIAERLADVAARTLAEVWPTLTCVTGGETTHALVRAVGASHLELTGSPVSGLAVGELVVNGTSTQRRLAVLTKAGGFGPPDLFVALLRGTRQ